MDSPDSGTSGLVVGLIGIGGALLGVFVQFGLTTWRELRQSRARRRRAVSAVMRELISIMHILHMALVRQAWWADPDEPPREEWATYRDDLAEELDLHSFNKISFVYDSLRSLSATRSEPLSPTVGDWSPSGIRVRWHLRKDKERRSFLQHIWTPDRWPEADANVRDAERAVDEAIEILRPIQIRMMRRRDQGRLNRRLNKLLEEAKEAETLEGGLARERPEDALKESLGHG